MPLSTPSWRRTKVVLAAMACGLALAGPTAPPAAADDFKTEPVLTADTTAVEPGVVRIDTRLDLQQAVGAGTGVVLSPDGIVLTNNHVIRGANDITATNVGNGRTYPVDVLGYDRKSDVAVLRLRGAADLPVAPTAPSSGVRVGDPVTAVGFPGGSGLTRSPGTVQGVAEDITANDELTGSTEELSGLIGFAADIRPGDSGGPLVDQAGRVVGITTAGSQNYRMGGAGGFAIPIDRALGIADAIRAGIPSGSIHVGPTGILGVGVGNDGDGSGVAVRALLRGGPAEQAGVRGGDVITAIDATPVTDGTVLTDVLDQRRPGDTVTVTLRDRAGASRDARVTLTAGPPN